MFSFFRRKFGGSMTDYGVGIGIIAGGAIGGIAGLGDNVEDIINGVNDSISEEVGEQTPGSGNSSGSGNSDNSGEGSGNSGNGGGNEEVEENTDPDPDTEPDPDPEPEQEPDVQPGDFQFVDVQNPEARILDDFSFYVYTENHNGSGVSYTVNGTLPYGTNYSIKHHSSLSHYMDFDGELRRPGTYNFSIRADLDGSTDYDLNNYSVEILPYYNAFIPEVEGYDDLPGSSGSDFGSAVAIDGDDVYVLSNFRDNQYDAIGRIYQFDYDSQIEQFNFEPIDTDAFNGSFIDIKIEGSSLFAGTQGWYGYSTPENQPVNRAQGAIYEFNKSTGEETRIYQFPEGYTTDATTGFGRSFVVNSSYIAMSANALDYGSTENVGRVYVSPRGQTGNLQTFNAISPQSHEMYGGALALYNNYLFVSAPNKNRQGLSSGVVYMYDLTTGNLVREILPADLQANDSFGFVMAQSNGVLAVGALVRSEVGTGMKAIYLFDANTGDQLHKFRSSEVGDGDPFSTYLAMDGNYLVLGSPEASGNAGKIYIYDVSQMQIIDSFSGNIDRGISRMGYNFDIDGRRVIVGAPSGGVQQALKYDF